jgi:DNA-binding NarL/FixJ family response regulator
MVLTMIALQAVAMHAPEVRILVVDDHPAMRRGLQAALETQPGFLPLGVAGTEEELWARFNAIKPDLVLLDYHLPATDGCMLCHRLKRELPAPAVVLYSAYADSRLAVPAVLAGADALIHKGLAATELVAVLSRVAAGERLLPPLHGNDVQSALGALDRDDAVIVRQLLEGGGPPADEARRVVESALERLRLDLPAASVAAG